MARCTSSLSITALCKLDLTFAFDLEPDDFANPEPGATGGSIGVVVALLSIEVVSRRWGGTIIGVVRGGGGHCT